MIPLLFIIIPVVLVLVVVAVVVFTSKGKTLTIKTDLTNIYYSIDGKNITKVTNGIDVKIKSGQRIYFYNPTENFKHSLDYDTFDKSNDATINANNTLFTIKGYTIIITSVYTPLASQLYTPSQTIYTPLASQIYSRSPAPAPARAPSRAPARAPPPKQPAPAPAKPPPPKQPAPAPAKPPPPKQPAPAPAKPPPPKPPPPKPPAPAPGPAPATTVDLSKIKGTWNLGTLLIKSGVLEYKPGNVTNDGDLQIPFNLLDKNYYKVSISIGTLTGNKAPITIKPLNVKIYNDKLSSVLSTESFTAESNKTITFNIMATKNGVLYIKVFTSNKTDLLKIKSLIIQKL